jgi:predicted ATPase/DNA-binding winged helix-turn-helix (wHTH) protein
MPASPCVVFDSVRQDRFLRRPFIACRPIRAKIIILHSARGGVDDLVYQCGDLRVDPANRRLTRGAIEIALEPKAFAVLLVLLARAEALVTRDELLDAVWGHRYVTPATLNRAMVLLRRAFDDDPDQARFIETVHGAGYRFIGPVERVAAYRGQVRAHFGPPPIAQLPAKLESLIGRHHEVAQLRAMLSEHRAVTVIGPGGMGKTRCALEVGRQCEGDFPDGVWFFDLSPLERAQDWLKALAATLSVPTAGTQALLPRLAGALAGRKALLLIDNCDRLAAEMGALVFELLRGCPDLKVLTTSQQRLDFVSERLMWLPPLDLPPPPEEAESLSLDAIASAPAVALLLARGRAVQPAISLGRDNVADIVEICRQLDGMPLALELAAARFAMLSPAALRERLRQRFSLLASESAGREPRHQTIRALVEWSYGLLSAQEQRLLCWLGVFLHGWTLDAAEAIGRALGIDGPRLLELHSGLILKSLVVVDPTLSPPRYRLLETVREFALQLLRTRGEEADARTAHLGHFVQLAERSHREIREFRTEWLARLRHEHANIDAALTWAKSDGADDEAALRLAGSLMLYGKGHVLLWLLDGWVARALVNVAPNASQTHARALLCSGMCKLYLQDAASESHLTQAAAIAMELSDRWTRGCATAFLAMWNATQGHLEQARAHAAVAVELADAEADDWLRSLAGLGKSWIALRSGKHDEALALLQPLRHLGYDLQQHEMIDIYLGFAHHCMGNWREAASSSLDLLELAVPWHHLRSAAGAIETAAFLAMRTSRPEICARFLGKAADIRERMRLPLLSFWVAYESEAADVVRATIGSGRFDALYDAGATERDELVFDEAREFLREVAEGHDSATRSPSG